MVSDPHKRRLGVRPTAQMGRNDQCKFVLEYPDRGPPKSKLPLTSALPPGPVLIDAVVNRTELAMPPSITLEMAKGFTLFMVKAVMGGRADEIIDLAKTNLWR